MSSLAQPGAGHDVFEAEPPELVGRNLRTGSHLLASATAFFFLGFLFAYFYLRSLNSGHMWRPPHVGPSQALGALTMLALVGSAALVRWGLADERAGRADGWRLKGGGALVLGLASVVLQVAEWLTQGFGPASGGYASVYVGWTSLFTVFVLGALFLGGDARCDLDPPPTQGTDIRERRQPARARGARHHRPCRRFAAVDRGAQLLHAVPGRARRADVGRPLPRVRRGGASSCRA
jgi:heme/copper-type cytochrome/quinol oxidase subunit 3